MSDIAFGAYDLECARWSEFRVGAFVTPEGERYLSWDEGEYFDRLRQVKGHLFAHNGGGYDALWAVEQCAARDIGFTAVPRGSGLLRVQLEDGPTLRDSLAIWPDRLAVCAQVTATPKISLGLPCECGEECGGYCALERDLSTRERSLVENYLEADIDACRGFLMAIHERAATDGIVLRDTVGATAWATAAEWCGLDRSHHSMARYLSIRRAYYGGRVEVYRPRARWGWRYDIHSSYPAALSRVLLPVGEPRHVTGLAATLAYVSGLPGVFTATVDVPECHSPPLPMRLPQRLYYPWGRLRGTWTALEIEHAEECGARIVAIESGYTWPDSAPALKPYADRIWALRDKAAGDGTDIGKAWAKWYKWIANSLTGKLAQRPGFSAYRYLPHPVDPATLVAAREAGSRPPIVTRRGVHMETRTSHLSPCAHVEWAAYLTAFARVEWHRQCLHAGRAMVYGDTDSVYSVEELDRRIGPNLGEWGCEGFMADWECAGPKLYRYRVGDKTKVRGKGLPGLTAAGYDALMRGEPWVTDRGVERYRSGRRTDALFARRRLERVYHARPGWCGARVWDGISEETRAPHVDERPT